MEICVDSIQSVVNACDGGASRLELCSALSLGGLTPSMSLFKLTKRKYPNMPVFVMIRPREGNFMYSDLELEEMLLSIEEFHSSGADGFVFGCVKHLPNNEACSSEVIVDEEATSKLIAECKGKPVTFHRAFDLCSDCEEALNTCATLGIWRILTSGGEKTALEGAEKLARLTKVASSSSVKILPGCGLNSSNISRFLHKSKSEFDIVFSELHASCRKLNTKIQTKNANVDFDLEHKTADLIQVKICADVLSKFQSVN